MQWGGRGRLGESLHSDQLVQQRGWLAQLSFQASRNRSVVCSQDPDFPVPKENTPLWVRVYRVMVQFETASQHPMWCQAQPFSSPIQSLGVLAARVVRTIFLGQTFKQTASPLPLQTLTKILLPSRNRNSDERRDVPVVESGDGFQLA